MIKALRFLVLTLSVGFAANAAAEVIFYDLEDFRGAMVRVDRPVDDFYNSGLNDRASSVSIRSGSWEICSDAHFRGQCVTLGPGETAPLPSTA